MPFDLSISLSPYVLPICTHLLTTQVVSVTAFNGGDDLGMIPNTVVLGGTLRAFSNTSFYRLLQRIEEVCHQTHSLSHLF